MLRADVSQFYPSLYTHAIGWAVDPKLRLKANWQNQRLLGKRLDQLVMNMQGKISQGGPIGNDVSFLLAEIVLGEVDKELREYSARAFRWFDDYEISCDSRGEAEVVLLRLRTALNRFNLRLNPKKTAILELPLSTSESWRREVADASHGAHLGHRNMVRFFDTVFDLRPKHPDQPILLYAMGLLFQISNPSSEVLRIAESCVSQAILCEPGCAQKAFALLTYWALNGASISHATVAAAIERTILRHETVGVTSDVSWALAFCIDQRLPLSRNAGKVLSRFEDDCIAIQSLHAHAAGLLPNGFSTRSIEAELRNATLDGPHWLAVYEAVRHGFLPTLSASVLGTPLFGDMLQRRVSFYRQAVPPYAAVIHPGGAPQWVVRAWLSTAARQDAHAGATAPKIAPPKGPVANLIRSDARRFARGASSFSDVIAKLLATMQLDDVSGDLDEMSGDDNGDRYA